MERAYHEQERQQRISKLFEESTSLTKECKFRRFEVTRALLSEGIALNALQPGSLLRAVLEKGNYQLGGRDAASEFIPMILQDERATVWEELRRSKTMKGQSSFRPMNLIFDGTTSVAEVFCVVVRFITDDGFLQQRVMALQHYESSLKADHLCQAISQILIYPRPHGYNIDPHSILAFMSDRASANMCALGRLLGGGAFATAEAIGCLSHTLSNAGERMSNENTAITVDFVSKWMNIIARSYKARGLFREKTWIGARRANLTRWYVTGGVAVSFLLLSSPPLSLTRSPLPLTLTLIPFLVFLLKVCGMGSHQPNGLSFWRHSPLSRRSAGGRHLS